MTWRPKLPRFHPLYVLTIVVVLIGGYYLWQRSGVKSISHSVSTSRVDDGLASELARHGVAQFDGDTRMDWVPMLAAWLVPVLLIAGGWWLMNRRFGGAAPRAVSTARSKLKVLVESSVKTKFADVAGVDEAKADLQEIVSFLKDPKGHGRLGARVPKGVILVGPPGTGKTLLARALAGEAGVPFFSISGSQFVEMFVGVGAARVRDLFEQARARSPAIVFIDELDALGRARGTGPAGGGLDEKEHTLNQLLVEMDGFDSTSGIVLLAATNRPEILDAALLRAGRFDRQVLVDRPDRFGRAQILHVHTAAVTLAPTLDVEEVARLTPGFTGADLANLVNEAALVATRRGASGISGQDFTAALERIVAGLEKKNRVITPRERAIVAHHEMGHAIVAAAQPSCDPVHKVSIIPRGIGALGYTIQRPTDDRWLMTQAELEAKMTTLLGGRAAERLVLGNVSTGAVDDLSRATAIARGMATRFAMTPQLGSLAYETDPHPYLDSGQQAQRRLYSERTAREIDDAMRSLVGAAVARATRILVRNRKLLVEGARLLLEKESLADEQLSELLRRVQPAPRARARPARQARGRARRSAAGAGPATSAPRLAHAALIDVTDAVGSVTPRSAAVSCAGPLAGSTGGRG